jgi:uncharacterized membrane protein
MLKNIFFTLVFFILDHFLILSVLSVMSVVALNYSYKIWRDPLRARDTRYLSLIISIVLVIGLIIFLVGVIYIITIIILYLPVFRKLLGK